MKNTRKANNILGLSLVEILIALTISTFLFMIIARATQTGGAGLATITSSNELLEDTRNAGEMILDSLQNSVYVYPPMTELELNDSTTYFNSNPNTNNNKWTIGKDPILAMIVAPRVNQQNCPTNPDACLNFIAYYTVKRSTVTAANGLTYAGIPLPADTTNPDALMLFEYKKVLDTDILSDTETPPVKSDDTSYAGKLNGVTARLVADYLDPTEGFVINSAIDPVTGLTTNPATCNTSGGLFRTASACPTTATAVNYKNSLSSGNFALKTFYEKGKRNYTTPKLVFEFSPRNLY